MKKLLFIVLLVLIGCSEQPDASKDYLKNFDAYMTKFAVKQLDGSYLVEGDIRMPDLESVQHYYLQAIGNTQKELIIPEKKVSTALKKPGKNFKGTVNLLSGTSTRDVWSSSAALDITYCISNLFGQRKADVIRLMERAADKWKVAANNKVGFRYVPAQDSKATPSNINVIFHIRPATADEQFHNPTTVASTFFPSYSRANRVFIVYKRSWTYERTEDYLYIHELGHTLGLRHEHIWYGTDGQLTGETRSNAELVSTTGCTAYDNASIMYYPQLAGYTSTPTYDLSTCDKAVIKILYP